MKKDDFDGQCQSQREGKDDKDKKINERVFFFLCFSSWEVLPAAWGLSLRRRRDNWSPSSWRGIQGEDAGCMLIKQNTNWKDRKEQKKTRPPFQLQTPLPPLLSSSLQESGVWWALIRWWLAQLLAELRRPSDFKTLCQSVCLSNWMPEINKL